MAACDRSPRRFGVIPSLFTLVVATVVSGAAGCGARDNGIFGPGTGGEGGEGASVADGGGGAGGKPAVLQA
ncbi:MAG: hypothetical protein RIF41_13760 [Polyangiaceae bacterium]